jgi:hypothetical protein
MNKDNAFAHSGSGITIAHSGNGITMSKIKMIEPIWNFPCTKQVIARAIRVHSHYKN